MFRRGLYLLLTLTLLPPTRADCDVADRVDSCKVLLAEKCTGCDTTELGRDYCHDLAVMIGTEMTDSLYLRQDIDSVVTTAFFDSVSSRDLQSRASGASATGGSVAQGEAVPTVQPLAIAGGSLAAAGSDAGSDAIAAMTINPAIFFLDPDSTEQIARYNRLTDLTILFPVNNLDRNADGRIDYYGIRLRLNVTGLSQGSELLRDAREAFEELVGDEADLDAVIADILRETPSLRPCVEALLQGSPDDEAAFESECGVAVKLTVDKEKYERFQKRLAEVRQKADSRYVGFDVRLDVGDPTLGAVDSASGTSMEWGLAFGKQFGRKHSNSPAVGVKGRLGVHYISLDDVDAHQLSVDGGLAFEIVRPVEVGRVSISSGFEFRAGKNDEFEKALQTNYVVFRTSVSVPFTQGTDLALNISTPISGDIGPTMSIKASWGLLFPNR